MRTPAVAYVERTGCTVVSDLEAPHAGFELHEGVGRAALQIATQGSSWLLMSVRPSCMLETIETSLLLDTGNVCMLPSGCAALLQATAHGRWLAVRCAGRALHFEHRERLSLARILLELSEWLRSDTAFALAQRARLATRLQRELERSRDETRIDAAYTAEHVAFHRTKDRRSRPATHETA